MTIEQANSMSKENHEIDRKTDIQAVVLDYGNVISRPQDSEAVERMAQIVGVSVGSLNEALWRFRDPYDAGLISDAEYWKQVSEQSKGVYLNSSAIWELTALDAFSWSIENPAMISWMMDLHRAGLSIAILSNMPETLAKYTVHNQFWAELVDAVIVSAEVKCTKPKRDIFEQLLFALDITPEHILFIDDKEENVAAAKDVGMQFIQFTDIVSFRQRLKASFPILPSS